MSQSESACDSREFCRHFAATLIQAEELIGAERPFSNAEDLRRWTQALFNRLMFQRFVEQAGWLDLEAVDRTLFTNAKFDCDLNVVPPAVLHLMSGENGLLNRYHFTLDESSAPSGAIGPQMLGAVFESLMTGRYESGSFYTPATVVSFMCREALKAVLATKSSASVEAIAALIDCRSSAGLSNSQVCELITVLNDLEAVDPACGCGAFLLGLLRELVALHRLLHSRTTGHSPSEFDVKLQIVRQNLYGVDRDPLAALIARQRLWLALAAEADGPAALKRANSNIETADSLLGPCHSLTDGSFDVVLANPPYLNMFAQQAASPAYRAALKDRFQSARRGFDLYVPFLERGVQLLNESGVLAYITPNKLLSAEYAAPIRSLLENSTTLLSLTDLSRVPVFGAAAYPCITIATKCQAAKLGTDVTAFAADPTGSSESHIVRSHAAPRQLAGEKAIPWTLYLDSTAGEILPALHANLMLKDVATITASATVDEAYRWKPAIIDGSQTRTDDEERYIPFLVSGNLQPFGDTWATQSVRYLKTVYQQPVIDTWHTAISIRRKAQMRSPKVVLSGLALRPTCAWFERPVATGVATVLVIPHAGIDGAYLAAVLNSAVMQKVYAVLFGSLSLSAGYMRFGVPQIKRLSLPDATPEDQKLIAALAKRCAQNGETDGCRAEIDERVARLYRVALP